GADLLPRGRVQPLTENLKLLTHQVAAVVVAVPDDQVFVGEAVVGHRRVFGAEMGVAVGPHVGDADLAADQGTGGRVEPLAIDLALAGRDIVAAPDDQVLVGAAVVGHRRLDGGEVGVAVGAHEGDAEVVGADLGGGQARLQLLHHRTPRLPAARPGGLGATR